MNEVALKFKIKSNKFIQNQRNPNPTNSTQLFIITQHTVI